MIDVAALPMHRAAHLGLLPRCWELRDDLTTDDAAYVAAQHHALSSESPHGTLPLRGEACLTERIAA
ncbi:hypothetical protein [Phycicoccus duodecadis]|uniref:Uncharacterized protein n=1 Tax=Phycicoccus duodecadis TaxID=173053 RepID=A0A2N3YL06_9MICO|nr:hypothetical protein [Phycicoccus duodecadis]PKW27489.1 hypothetical protein ATL31_2333 [Phycicoccus duodecadis]